MTIDIPKIFRSIWIPWLAVTVLALLFGWSGYRDAPQGTMIFSGDTPCPVVRHSFSYLMTTLLAIGASVAVVIAIGLGIASQLGIVGAAKPRLRYLAVCGVALALALGLTMLLKFPVEAMVKLKPAAPCTTIVKPAG